MRRILMLLLCLCLPLNGLWAQSNLELGARVWGLLKYRHPQLVQCARDWDAALLQSLPAIEAASTRAARDAALLALVAKAGSVVGAAPDAQTPAWIRDLDMDETLRMQLAAIAKLRPNRQCYVAAGDSEQASFASDIGQFAVQPDRSQRLLAAYRYWNAVEYFFPYKAEIGRDWSDVLAEYLPAIADSATTPDFALAMRQFSSQIHDTHAFFSSPYLAPQPYAYPPVRIKSVEGRWLVDRRLAQAPTVQVGDELISIDGEAVASQRARRQDYVYGSNPVIRESIGIEQTIASSGYDSSVFEFEHADGSRYSALLRRGPAFSIRPCRKAMHRHGGCRPAGNAVSA